MENFNEMKKVVGIMDIDANRVKYSSELTKKVKIS